MITNTLRRAVRFFVAYAGGIVGQCWKGALDLARAEQWAETHDYSFVWEYDSDADLGDHEYWCKNAKDIARLSRHEQREHDVYPCAHEAYWCAMKDADGNTVQSLGGIIDPSDAYRRVIEAELASQEMHEHDHSAYSLGAYTA